MFDGKRKIVAGGLGAASIMWMALIFYLSTLTGQEAKQGLDSSRAGWIGESLRSYAAHAVLYGVLAALIQSAIWGWNRSPNVRWVIGVVVFVSLFGTSDEYYQSFVEGRSATVADVIVDTMGAALAAILVWILVTKVPRRNLDRP